MRHPTAIQLSVAEDIGSEHEGLPVPQIDKRNAYPVTSLDVLKGRERHMVVVGVLNRAAR
jgi:hypothetical protein